MDEDTPSLAEELGAGALMRASVDLVEGYIKPEIKTVTDPLTGIPALVHISRSGINAVPASVFDDYREQPVRRKGTATLFDLDSFIEQSKRFLTNGTLVFANNDRSAPSLTTVFDYHPAGYDSAPRFGTHRAHFAFPLSDEWKAWQAFNSKTMDMADFAAFLEDRIVDVLDTSEVSLTEEQQRYVDRLGGRGRIATPAKLMEIATGLQVFEDVETVNAVKLESGEAQMTFNSTHRDAQGGQLTVPSLFALGIPVFVNDDAYQILVRLRYRPAGGKVLFFYELWRTDLVFDHAFDEAVSKVKEDTGLEVRLGKPEA